MFGHDRSNCTLYTLLISHSSKQRNDNIRLGTAGYSRLNLTRNLVNQLIVNVRLRTRSLQLGPEV